MRTYAIDFELSDIIKQARETEIIKQKQIETDMKTTEKQVQDITENNNSEQITNSSNDIKKEQK
jgi:hypothetical protein